MLWSSLLAYLLLVMRRRPPSRWGLPCLPRWSISLSNNEDLDAFWRIRNPTLASVSKANNINIISLFLLPPTNAFQFLPSLLHNANPLNTMHVPWQRRAASPSAVLAIFIFRPSGTTQTTSKWRRSAKLKRRVVAVVQRMQGPPTKTRKTPINLEQTPSAGLVTIFCTVWIFFVPLVRLCSRPQIITSLTWWECTWLFLSSYSFSYSYPLPQTSTLLPALYVREENLEGLALSLLETLQCLCEPEVYGQPEHMHMGHDDC